MFFIAVLLTVVGFCFCVWRLGRAAASLNLSEHDGENQAIELPATKRIKNSLIAAPIFLIFFYTITRTTPLLTTVAIVLLIGWLWFEAYRARIKPLILAGLPSTQAIVLTAIQGLWLVPAASALAIHFAGRYGAP
jgi:hypothetical protein